MGDILDVLKNRRSIRRYRPDPVPEDLMDRILEAGLYAPTGKNRQETIILKITDPDTVRSLGLINGRLMGREGVDAFYGAPAVLAVLSPKSDPTAVEDGCSVIVNMLNEAASLGLGSCWIHRGKAQFETPEGREILRKAGIDPDAYLGIDNMIVGYADGANPAAPARKEGRTFSL
jgi:nitroreductase